MRLLITRPRIQYDSTAIYEPLVVEYHEEDFTVRQLKELIAKRQRLLSTGEKPRVGAEDSKVIVRAAGAGELFREARRARGGRRPARRRCRRATRSCSSASSATRPCTASTSRTR